MATSPNAHHTRPAAPNAARTRATPSGPSDANPLPASAPLPTGVEIHGHSLRIVFSYRGQRCREVVERNTDALAQACAARLRTQVLQAIQAGTFCYRSFFPDSPRAARFDQPEVTPAGLPLHPRMTVREGVAEWLATKRLETAPSTWRNYRSKSEHVLEAFGERPLAEVSAQELKRFGPRLHQDKGLSKKTINEVLIVVRGIWRDAELNDLTGSNRAADVKGLPQKHRSQADPFSLAEMQRLLQTSPGHLPVARMVVCNCWMGLSRSELLALAREDVDLVNRRLEVRRAWVQGQFKATKTAVRRRRIELLEPAVELLRAILADSAYSPVLPLGMADDEADATAPTAIQLLFRDPRTGGPWAATSLDRAFKAVLAEVAVRPRGLNQSRHTFASRALSTLQPRAWIIRQLGHVDEAMLHRHYGTWLTAETPTQGHSATAAMTRGWHRAANDAEPTPAPRRVRAAPH